MRFGAGLSMITLGVVIGLVPVFWPI